MINNLVRLGKMSWEEFTKLSTKNRAPYLSDDSDRFVHLIYAQQFNRDNLEYIGQLATKIRMMAKSKEGSDFLSTLLSDKRAMLYFTQPSTRTFLSFMAACQILGMKVAEVRDATTSSEYKGESAEDSVRVFSSYSDLIVMRTKLKGLAERMAWLLSNSKRLVPIINAGSGKDQHPTQALLDIYTLQRSFEDINGIDGKHIVFVGDLLRGRTVRSLAFLLGNYNDVKMTFVAPDAFQIGSDILEYLDKKGIQYDLSQNFKSVIPTADAIYMTRVQDEWDNEEGESAKVDISNFWFGDEELKLLQKHAVIMHPLPRREEISTSVDQDKRAVYWRQMRNGMWVRAALIANIFAVDTEILNFSE
ncbi:MAG: aspartate carbamoyltransferase [Kiritimatiellae bacterium]|jgi:aspartate carbamoyltransferase catalytic subunit|nr:aspartate carbamoyltransferase [Kiritimatiellia bacterium]